MRKTIVYLCDRFTRNLLQGKKSDLVKKLATYFKSLLTKKTLNDEEKHTRNWLPEAMSFPAIDPDAAARAAQQQEPEPEGEEFSGEDGEEETLSDDEDLSKAA